mmetsp:Transcript_29064/g.56944  ORF Transcript_29064/g.56944 Transcript_29064/m.56944 type:complete len:219 (+) Transcript_29064:236-892(+)
MIFRQVSLSQISQIKHEGNESVLPVCGDSVPESEAVSRLGLSAPCQTHDIAVKQGREHAERHVLGRFYQSNTHTHVQLPHLSLQTAFYDIFRSSPGSPLKFCDCQRAGRRKQAPVRCQPTPDDDGGRPRCDHQRNLWVARTRGFQLCFLSGSLRFYCSYLGLFFYRKFALSNFRVTIASQATETWAGGTEALVRCSVRHVCIILQTAIGSTKFCHVKT